MSESTSGRLLTLLSLLQGRRDWPGHELADRLEVSPRTIRRDVGRLRELGYPVESMTGPAGGYQLRAGTAMPPLLLDDDEAIAIAVGLRTAAGSSVEGIEETSLRALVKLEQVLPSHLQRRVRALQSATSTLAWGGGPQVDPQCLTVIATACRDHERIRFAYRARDQTDSRRDVEPHALVNAGRRWYLVAWDRTRDAWRTFRVDRIARPAPAGGRFKQRTIPGRDPAAFVARSIEGAPGRYEARVTLHAPAEAFAERRYGGTITPVDGERCELRLSENDLDWLAVRILMLGVDFEAHEPPELAERLGEMGARIRRSCDA